MNFSKSITAAFAVVATFSVSGCLENIKENTPDLSEDGIEFKIEVSDPTDKGATFLITNNGTDKNTWYAFAYDDVNTSPEAAINRKVKQNKLHWQTKCGIQILSSIPIIRIRQ